jgi:hypothetical protein
MTKRTSPYFPQCASSFRTPTILFFTHAEKENNFMGAIVLTKESNFIVAIYLAKEGKFI